MTTMAEIAHYHHQDENPPGDPSMPGQWDPGRSWAAEPDDEPTTCQFCDGPLVELGTLGWIKHFRCRNCGAQFSDSTTPRRVDRVPENGC